MDAYRTLKAQIVKIDAVMSAASIARNLPQERVYAVTRLNILSGHHTDAQKIIFARMLAEAVAVERAAGEVARDRELKRLAVELGQLRADLREIASAAAFDMIDTVRGMKA